MSVTPCIHTRGRVIDKQACIGAVAHVHDTIDHTQTRTGMLHGVDAAQVYTEGDVLNGTLASAHTLGLGMLCVG